MITLAIAVILTFLLRRTLEDDQSMILSKRREQIPPGRGQKLEMKMGLSTFGCQSVLLQYCQSRGIAIELQDTVAIIKEKMKTKLQQEKMQVELLAEAAGHKVVFMPPCHSDFQPIELLWAKLKGNIGRKYDSNTSMDVLKQRLDEEFAAAMAWNESIEGMIYKSTKTAASFYKQLLAENEEPETRAASDASDTDTSEDDEESVLAIAL